MFFEQMHPLWQSYLADQRELLDLIEKQVLPSTELVPPASLVMQVFRADPKSVRAVIVGQDPYPNPGDAIGLAFAVPAGQKRPQSLKNVFQELSDDLGIPVSPEANLLTWADRGVLLLNTSLTTLPHQPGAHSKLGWHEFTLAALEQLASKQPLVVLAWGNHAKLVVKNLPEAKVIESAHPSPLSASRGFFGSRPFSRANQALIELGLEPIDWSL